MDGTDARLAGAIAGVAAVLVALAGASPTGSVVDSVLVVLAVAGCVWAAASAPWWSGVVAAAVGAALAPHWWLVVLAFTAAGTGLWIGLARRSLPWSRALVAGVAVQVLARLDNVSRFGLTSLVAIAVMFTLAWLGIRRRPRRHRRLMYVVFGGVAAAAGVAVLGFAVAAATARAHLQQGSDAARAGIDLINDGRFDEAREAFARASEQFASADSALTRPWGLPAALVPIVAQHRESAVLLAGEGSDVTGAIATALEAVDYDALRVVNGSIDIAAIEALQTPLANLNGAVDDLQAAVLKARSPWLVGAVSSRLDDLLAEIDEQRVKLGNAQAAVNQAPAMLGADGKRVYFVAFTTPSEARGLGGFMGNWAEVTITNGKIEFTEFGRHTDLATAGDPDGRFLKDLPADYLQRYAGFLLSDPDTGLVGIGAWANITSSPSFPYVAQTISELYPQSGGTQLDGVFALDVKATATLMSITGAVPLPDGTMLQPEEAEQFLLADQYLQVQSNPERIDLLQNVALTTMQRLLSSTLPSPPVLGDLFGPLAREGRLAAWAPRPDEQDVFARIGMAGLLPSLDGGDGLAISFNNSGANKIDYFLEGSASYDVDVDRGADTVTGTITLTVDNSSPASGLPTYVIGNLVGESIGTNITYLTVYTGLPVTGYTVDGEPGEFSISSEAGYNAASTYLAIPAGESSTIVLTVQGSIPDDVPYRLTVSNMPLVHPFPIDVTIDGDETPPITDAGVWNRP